MIFLLAFYLYDYFIDPRFNMELRYIIILLVFFNIPLLYLHFEYYFHDFRKILEVDSERKIIKIRDQQERIIKFDDIEKIIKFHCTSRKMPYSMYFFHSLILKNSDEIKISCLLVDEDFIINNKYEMVGVLFPSIDLNF